MLEKLKKHNPTVQFYDISDYEFNLYGQIYTQYDCSEIMQYMEEKTSIPEERNQYIASDSTMEEFVICQQIQTDIFGEMEIQVGYCNGNNDLLNALEFHKSSEVNIAITDLVLLLGKTQDIDSNNNYDTSNIKAFYIPKGTVFEIYGETMHFSPCKLSDNGFKCVVILLKDTNTPLKQKVHNNKLLFMKNKWILIHPSFERFATMGAHIGLEGENIIVNYKED